MKYHQKKRGMNIHVRFKNRLDPVAKIGTNAINLVMQENSQVTHAVYSTFPTKTKQNKTKHYDIQTML